MVESGVVVYVFVSCGGRVCVLCCASLCLVFGCVCVPCLYLVGRACVVVAVLSYVLNTCGLLYVILIVCVGLFLKIGIVIGVVCLCVASDCIK